MKILIDADACPVTDITINLARKHNIPVTIITDTAHLIYRDYAETIIVDKGKDSVDFSLVNRVYNGDLVITQDYGVAAMVLSKKGYAINQNGLVFNKDNIDQLLMNRHISKQTRQAGGKVFHPKKRTKDHDIRFKNALNELISRIQEESHS